MVRLWAKQAACRGLTELMVMPKAGGSRKAEIEAAREVCWSCPVYVECRDWVLAIKPDPTPQMVTAGMIPAERNTARKALLYAETDARGHQRRWTTDPGRRTERSESRLGA